MSHICPRCGIRNDDNFPVLVGDSIETGGCELCFNDGMDNSSTICAACGDALATAGESICSLCRDELMDGGPAWVDGGEIERLVASENPVPVWW